MEELTVVFPIYITPDGMVKILIGKKAPGTKLAGFRNGYGGKCEKGEEPLDCAVREVKEEIGIDLEKDRLKSVCITKEGEKLVYFYVYELDSEIQVSDSTDFVDNKWFVLQNIDYYVDEMLAEDRSLMQVVSDVVIRGEYLTFEFKPKSLDFSTSELLRKQTSGIYK